MIALLAILAALIIVAFVGLVACSLRNQTHPTIWR